MERDGERLTETLRRREMQRETNRQTDRQTDRRQRDRVLPTPDASRADGERERWAESAGGGGADRQTDRQTDRVLSTPEVCVSVSVVGFLCII